MNIEYFDDDDDDEVDYGDDDDDDEMIITLIRIIKRTFKTGLYLYVNLFSKCIVDHTKP